MNKRFTWRSRLASFRYAFAGFRVLFRSEPNALLHLLAAIAVVVAGFWTGLSRTEWALVILSVVLVFGMELINTAVEQLCDHVEPSRHPDIKRIKDLSAAAVLAVAIGAAAVGAMVFLPKWLSLL